MPVNSSLGGPGHPDTGGQVLAKGGWCMATPVTAQLGFFCPRLSRGGSLGPQGLAPLVL